jgi:TolB-like protein
VKQASVRALLIVLMATAPASHLARESKEPERIWILPFTQLQPDPAIEYFEDALPALVAAAVSASGGRHAVVEREDLNTVLGEQSLSLGGLSSPGTRQRVGKLLGATVMITGSFRREGPQLHVTMHAADLETGIVASTAEGRGAASQPGALVVDLYRRLAGGFGRPLPAPAAGQVDEAPLSNLHFMKGLGHYYSARYSHSLAEFMLAAEDRSLADVSSFWLAKAYLAERRYLHACLELTRLMDGGPAGVPARDVAAGMRECEPHLSSEDRKMIRDLLEAGDRKAR